MAELYVTIYSQQLVVGSLGLHVLRKQKDGTSDLGCYMQREDHFQDCSVVVPLVLILSHMKASVTDQKDGTLSFTLTCLLQVAFCHNPEAAGHWCPWALETEELELGDWSAVLCVFQSVCLPPPTLLRLH